MKACSRYHAFTLGTDLRNGSRRLLTLVVRANSREDKVPLLLDLREEVEALKVVLPVRRREGVFELPIVRARDHAGRGNREAK